LETTMQDNEKPKSLHAREDLIHDRFECVNAELTVHISTLTKAMRHSHINVCGLDENKPFLLCSVTDP
jgi:hypothetical protein